MTIIGYLSALLMGLILSLIGGGGSILTVPILVYFFSTDPLLATSESLFIVGGTALFGGLAALIRKEAQLRVVFQFAISSFIGVFLMKKYILGFVPDMFFLGSPFSFSKATFVMMLFAILMIVVSLKMIRAKESVFEMANQKHTDFKRLFIYGFSVGNITGLVGAGGGFLIVPALVHFLGLKMRSAVGTSLLIIAANSLFGFSLFLFTGQSVDWMKLITLLGISFVGLSGGRLFFKNIQDRQLKTGFGYLVLLMGLFIFIEQFRSLYFVFQARK